MMTHLKALCVARSMEILKVSFLVFDVDVRRKCIKHLSVAKLNEQIKN